MSWASSAEALLAAANTAALSAPVARSLIAPGPAFARDCRMLAVYLESVDAVPLSDAIPGGQGCALIPAINLRLVFAADCVPTPNDAGSPPSPAAVTAWSLAFLADAAAIWDAVADAAADGSLGDCDGVSIGQSTPTGPTGQMATMQTPVRLLSL